MSDLVDNGELVASDRDAGGPLELTGLGPSLSEEGEQGEVGIEDLYVVEGEVGDVSYNFV